MSRTRLSLGALTAALLVLVAIGLAQLGGGGDTRLTALTPAQMSARLAGSPPTLAALHAQANRLLGGGITALRGRLASLHGVPVVLNKWASWCEPCRAEFGVFQHAATNLGRQVAFVGVDSGDATRAAPETFLRSFPVSYPSYFDPTGQAGAAVTDSSFTPVTVIYDRAGGFYIHQGPYPSVAKLESDVWRYALSG